MVEINSNYDSSSCVVLTIKSKYFWSQFSWAKKVQRELHKLTVSIKMKRFYAYLFNIYNFYNIILYLAVTSSLQQCFYDFIMVIIIFVASVKRLLFDQ